MGRIKNYIKHLNIPFWYALLVITVCVACCTSCKTKYVTVPEYHTRYTHNTDTFLRSDTTLIRDSVIIRTQGDTTIVEKIRWRDRIIKVYKIKTDSVIQRDSIRVPYPVEESLSKWEQAKMDFGGIAIGGTLALVILVIIRVTKSVHKI
ncbi:hypothetical protein HMPREF0645_2628 [Hallella bergensis DSM 17361]|uniref:Uncharacterized protein n=1 Tax=Hallella bergensis DSM 17361 TaxID=585502 RepID=D1Q093_9BACT|nr:hypothetical protein HMPREF0645_2628 [Hallella bergensis DSM 17361]